MNLIDRLRVGEPRAWDEVVESYFPQVYSLFKKRGVQETEISDLVQEVFVAAFKSLGTFKSGLNGGGIGGWLHGIASHKLIDHFRDHGKHRRGIGGSAAQDQLRQIADPAICDQSNVSGVTDAHEFSPTIRAALEVVRVEFEDTSWQAFWSTTILGMPAASVAADLGTSRNAVYLARSRILRRLREEISNKTERAEHE